MAVTNYYLAWRAFIRTEDYRISRQILYNQGIKPKYASNILRVAFDAGWGNRKIISSK